MIVNEDIIVEIVRPGTGDPVPEGEVGEVRGDLARSALSADPLRAGRSLRRAAGPLAVRPHQHAHQGLDGPRRPDHQGEGHVRAPRADRRGDAPASRISRARLVVTRDNEQDAMTLHGRDAPGMPTTSPRPSPRPCRRVTKLQGQRAACRSRRAAERRQGHRGRAAGKLDCVVQEGVRDASHAVDIRLDAVRFRSGDT